MDKYINLVALVCRQSAILEVALQRTVSSAFLIEQLSLLSQAIAALKEEKKRLGMEDEVSFLKDTSSFCGFSFKDGVLSGDYTNLPAIAENYFRTNEHYKYEISVLLLSHYYMQEGIYPFVGKDRVTYREFILPWYKRVTRKWLKKKGGRSKRSA